MHGCIGVFGLDRNGSRQYPPATLLRSESGRISLAARILLSLRARAWCSRSRLQCARRLCCRGSLAVDCGRGMMAPTTSSPIQSGTGRDLLRGLIMPVTIVGAILVFVVPIPPALLDVLLSVNLTVAVIV